MDALDAALYRATPHADPTRTLSPHLAKPLRSWSLALRAGDTRLIPGYHPAESHLHPEIHTPIPSVPAQIENPQLIPLTTPELRTLCSPITIPPPGIPINAAAKTLGRSPLSIRRLIKAGHLSANPITTKTPSPYPRRFPTSHYTLVTTKFPIDPAGETWSPPWGAQRRRLIDQLPEDFQQTLLRVQRPIGAQSRQWQWLCPTCHQMVFKLYLPFPPLDIRPHLHLPRPTEPDSASPDRPVSGPDIFTQPDTSPPTSNHPTPHPTEPGPVVPDRPVHGPELPTHFACRSCARLIYESTERTAKDGHGRPCNHFDRFIQRLSRAALKSRDLN